MARACRIERGFALVGAIAVMALLAGLTASVLLVTLSDSRAASVGAARARALAAAEAGAIFQWQEARLGRGQTALAGEFGGSTYTAAPALEVSSGLWSITCTALLGRERRVYELLVAEEPAISPLGINSVRVQGAGVLTALLPLLGDWRISGRDTTPPSISGKSFDDLTEIGNGPLGNTARPAVIVHDAIPQKLVIATQITLLNMSKIDGKDVGGALASGAASVIVDPAEAVDLARLTSELRAGATVINYTTARTIFGSWSTPEVVFLENGARVSSIQGTGVLVLTGDNIMLTGDLKWEGLVIHYSQNPIDLSLVVGGKIRVFGGHLIQDPNSLVLVDSALDAHYLYSSQAVERALGRVQAATLTVVGSRVIL